MKWNAKKGAPILVGGLITLALAGGIVGITALNNAPTAPTNAIGDTTFAIAYGNTEIDAETKTLRFTSNGEAAGSIIEFAIDGEYEDTGARNEMIVLKDGASITTKALGGEEPIRLLTSLTATWGGEGTLTLETSRDGIGYVASGELTSGEAVNFAYPPHYFRLTATGEVTLRTIVITDDCSDNSLSISTYVGDWKGTVTVYDYYGSGELTTEATAKVTADGTVSGLKVYDFVNYEWVDFSLHLIDEGNPEVYLAADKNDPNPVDVYTLNWNGVGDSISITASEIVSEDGMAYYDYDFVGDIFNPSEKIEIRDAQYGGNVITSLDLKVGESATVYAFLDYNATDEIVWTVDDEAVATLGADGDKTITTYPDGTSYQMVKINGVGAGDAVITADTGYVEATLNVHVEASAGELVVEVPDYLNNDVYEWTSGTVDLYFYSDHVTVSDDTYEWYENEMYLTSDSSKDGDIYTLHFYDEYVSEQTLILEYNDVDKTLKTTADSELWSDMEFTPGNTIW